MEKYCIVLTTFANEADSTAVINAVLENKLAACAQVMNIASHYTWQGKVQHEPEILVLFKTTWNSYDALESKIKSMHSYDVPEIIAIDIKRGSPSYFSWIDEVTKKID